MKQLKLILTPKAERDLVEVRDWYDLQQPGVGSDFIREMGKQLADIERNPKAFAAGFRGTRKALMNRFPYIVYYRIRSDHIDAYAILHTSRHSSAWTSRLP